MSGVPGSKSLHGSGGLVLIEVLMAVVLLAVLIVPLAMGVRLAASRADAVRGKAIGASALTGVSGTIDAWGWGLAVTSAWWRPGPTLHIRTETGMGKTEVQSSQDVVAGLWADGWFLGEWAPGDDGSVQVGAPALTDVVGGELVVRVRRSGGVWGPPWRLVVPTADGLSALFTAGGGPSGEVVAHVPALANPALWLSWAAAPAEEAPPGLPFILPTASPGISGIDLDGRGQSWKTEEGRGLDVYF